MYSVRKFPDLDKEDWVAANREQVDEELTQYEGAFEGPLKEALEQLITEYVYASSTMKEVVEWKQEFARFLSFAISAAEGAIKEKSDKIDFQNGRLAMIKEILEWF